MKAAIFLIAGWMSLPVWAGGEIACERGAIDRNLNEAQSKAFIQRCRKDGGAAEAVLQCERQVKGKKLHDQHKEAIIRLCIAELVAPRR